MSDDQPQAIYRILDACANRAAEGMRTLEEFARFVLNDPEQSGGWKTLRHELSSALGNLPRERLLRARDTERDVGTDLQHPREYRRDDLTKVIAAAASRTQQSLRVLEEYGKTIDPASAGLIEQIRYRAYTLAAELELKSDRQHRQGRLAAGQLYALIDCESDPETFTHRIARLADAGVDLFQLRDPDADDRTLFQRARIGTATANQHGALFIMNDRADIAIAAAADGVHVGQEELPVAAARQIVGPNRLIGVSTHSIQQARQAVADGADYIGCGPTFPGTTKNFAEYPGTELLIQIAAEIQIPAFAIGGIDGSNVDQVVRTGVRRIAVTAAIRNADDPSAEVGRLRRLLGAADAGED